VTNGVLSILHYSCRDATYPNHKELYHNLNLVVKCHDSFYDKVLLNRTKMFIEVPVITDLEKWEHFYDNRTYEWDDTKKAYCMVNQFTYDESAFMSRGNIINDFFLEHIEKFDVYRFNCNVKKNTATAGLVKYLEELCNFKDLNDKQLYDLLTTLKALNDF